MPAADRAADLRIPASARGSRLDRAARDVLAAAGIPTSVNEVRAALRAGRVRVDGRRVPPGRSVEGGERLDTRAFVPRRQAKVRPRPDLLAGHPLVFDAGDWFALAKGSGLPTLPLDPEDDALLGAAVAVDPAVAVAGPPLEGGAVHRLDTATSGLVLFARTAAARARLRAAFRSHDALKGYEALVRGGGPVPPVVRAPIETTGGPRVRVRAPRPGELDVPESRLERLEASDSAARVLVITRWGRRHQVRAQLAHIGRAVLGDPLYAEPADAAAFPRLALHAAWIAIDGRRVTLPSGWAGQAPWRG